MKTELFGEQHDFLFPVLEEKPNTEMLINQIIHSTSEENAVSTHDSQQFPSQEAIKKIELDLATKKIEYEQKLTMIDKLLGKFEKPLSVLDDEIIDLIHYIIKKSVKNLIYKEIKADTKLVNRIIRELSELIHAKNGLLTVYLSEADFNRLKDKDADPRMIYKINDNLTEGDIVLESNYSEIKATLNERLNQILGIKYV